MEGILGVIKKTKDFTNGIDAFIELTDDVASLVPSDIRSAINHANLLTSKNCSACLLTASFIEAAYERINDKVEDFISFEDFDPCDHIDKLQEALDFVPNDANSYVDLIVIPEELNSTLLGYYGNTTRFDGQFLLENFGYLSGELLLP